MVIHRRLIVSFHVIFSKETHLYGLLQVILIYVLKAPIIHFYQYLQLLLISLSRIILSDLIGWPSIVPYSKCNLKNTF